MTGKCQRAYELRAQGLKWAEVGEAIGSKANTATTAARHWALQNGLPWPLLRKTTPAKHMPRLLSFVCDGCGKEAKKRTGCINRARKVGRKVYCSRTCYAEDSVQDRRSKEEKKADKAAYDREYRAENKERRKAQKKAYYTPERNKADYQKMRARMAADPALKADFKRRQRECYMRPEYREKKRKADREWRAKRRFGAFWESHIAILEIGEEIAKVASRQEIYVHRGVYNKKQERRREWERNHPQKP